MLFISFATEDQHVAEEAVRYFESAGARCWFAPRDARPGKPYAQEIVDAIENSRALVLLLSRHASASKYVANEIERAEHKEKPVYTLSIDGEKPAGSLEFFLSSKQWIDASAPPLGDHLRRVADALSLGAPPVVGPRRPASRTTRWIVASATFAATAVVVVVVFILMRPTPTCSVDVWFDPGDGVSPDSISVGNQQRKYRGGPLTFRNVPSKEVEVSLTQGRAELGSLSVPGCPSRPLTIPIHGGKLELKKKL